MFEEDMMQKWKLFQKRHRVFKRDIFGEDNEQSLKLEGKTEKVLKNCP